MSDFNFDVICHMMECLDPLSDVDRKLLKSLALCCRSWLSPAQKELFRSVSLETKFERCAEYIDDWLRGKREELFARFSQALQESPHLSSYVRSIKCTVYNEERTCVLGNILSQLHLLQRLHLWFAPSIPLHPTPSRLDWQSFSWSEHRKFLTAINDILKNPNLVHFCVWDIVNFPLEAFTNRAGYISVKEPRRFAIEIDIGRDDNSNTSSTAPLSIQTYEVACIPWPQSYKEEIIDGKAYLSSSYPRIHAFDFSSLDRLSVCWGLDDAVHETVRLTQVTIALEQVRLTVTHPETFSEFSKILLPTMFKSLQVLELEFHVPAPDDVLYHLEQLPEQLQLLAGQNVLEVFSLSIHAYTEQYECDMRPLLTGLDKIVCRSTFPNLKTFNMTFVVFAESFWNCNRPASLSTIPEIREEH